MAMITADWSRMPNNKVIMMTIMMGASVSVTRTNWKRNSDVRWPMAKQGWPMAKQQNQKTRGEELCDDLTWDLANQSDCIYWPTKTNMKRNPYGHLYYV